MCDGMCKMSWCEVARTSITRCGKQDVSSKPTKGTFRGVITRRKEKRQQMHLESKLKVKNLESKNMEQKKKFCFRPMMLKQHLCANQLKVPRCVQSWLLENTQKKKIQSAKCKHIIFICDLQSTYWKLGCIRFPNKKWHLTLAFYNSRIMHGFDTNDHIWQEQGKSKLKESPT